MNKRKQGAATRTTRRGRAAKMPGAETEHKSASGAFAIAAECTVADAGYAEVGAGKLLDDTGVVTLDIGAVQRIDTAGLQVIATFVRERESHGRQVSGAAQHPPCGGGETPRSELVPQTIRLGVETPMTIDLTQFHDAFYEESFEALDSMEAALLKLDIGAPEPELINTIFRVAHSIKGGSATFGFSDIASFTHSCETLLDELRSGGMQVSLESRTCC